MTKQKIPYGYIEGDKIYLEGWGSHSDRQIGQVKDNDQQTSTEYFKKKFEELEEKVSKLEEKIDQNDNKGSFQMQLKHLQESLCKHDGLGDYQSLHDRLQKQINFIEDLIQKNRSRNTDIKQALLEEAKEAVELVNWREATEKVQAIKERWIKTGNAAEDMNEKLNEEFWSIFNDFYQRKQEFYEDKIKLSKHYEEKYKELIERAKGLVELAPEAKKKVEDELKTLWKGNGNVPNEIYKKLLNEFNKQLKKTRRDLDINKFLQDLEKQSGLLDEKNINFKAAINQLKSFRPAEKAEREKKTKAFEKLLHLQEIDFVYKQVARRRKDFKELSDQDKKKHMANLVSELLERDRAELKTIEENSMQFKSHNENFQKMMDKKLSQQRQKIEIKEKILAELKS